MPGTLIKTVYFASTLNGVVALEEFEDYKYVEHTVSQVIQKIRDTFNTSPFGIIAILRGDKLTYMTPEPDDETKEEVERKIKELFRH